MGYSPVSPFVVVPCPAPPVSTRTSPQLPCRSLARSSRGSRHDPSGSYSGHTPSLRDLKHPADQGQAPGTTPAPADLPRLADDLHPSVHVASGCYPAGLCTVCLGFPTSIVSARRALRFLRVETRSTRLSLGARSSRFGTVSARIYWQALAGPFMVELFTAECFAPSPTPVRSASPLAELKAPHASRVERAPWPEPLGRDFHPLCAITASMVNHRGFSLSPRLGGESRQSRPCGNAETPTFRDYRVSSIG